MQKQTKTTKYNSQDVRNEQTDMLIQSLFGMAVDTPAKAHVEHTRRHTTRIIHHALRWPPKPLGGGAKIQFWTPCNN
jgi:hypothetical protein